MTPKSRMIPVEYFHEIMEYREEVVDGVLQGNVYWKNHGDKSYAWNCQYAGKRVGNLNITDGYCKTSITYNNIRCPLKMHIIVFILNKNRYPDGHIDHIDRNKTNNLIKNLEDGTLSDNANNKGAQSNAASHFRTVFKHKENKWRVRVKIDGIRICYGVFDDELEAAQKANEVLIKHYGHSKNLYLNDISMGYTNKAYPNKPRHYEPEKVAA